MNLTRLAWANLRATPITSALNVGLLALGTATIVVLLLFSHQLDQTLTRDAEGIDLVLGAKGSPVQLVLSTVYHADLPTGNIPLAEAQRWTEDRRIAQAIPMSLGDSARGFRIVGTTPAYPALYDADLAKGRLWDASLEAVIGAEVAQATGLRPGDLLVGSHGMTGMGDRHAASPYRVVGILSATGAVVDRLILTSLDSVWDIHDGEHGHGEHEHGHGHGQGHDPAEDHAKPPAVDEAGGESRGAPHEPEHDEEHSGNIGHAHGDGHSHGGDHSHEDKVERGHNEAAGTDHDASEQDALAEADPDREITAMLVTYASPVAAASLPRQINSLSNLQAAAPAFELARLLQIVGLGLEGLRAFALILIVSAAFSVFGAMYGALQTRRGELAMMRCLGGTRAELMASLMIEGLLLGLAGAALGLLVGHATVEVVGSALTESRGIALTGAVLLFEELLLAAGLVLVALLAAAVPAWQAYRTDVSRTLASHG
ncbi:MAG: FtsX-like permease family protein [Acidobacteriota bacterium]